MKNWPRSLIHDGVIIMDQETKKKIKDIVAKTADGNLPIKSAVAEIIHLVENYADRAVVAYLELERKGPAQ